MNALRLAFGTLTVLPMRAPHVDRATAGRAMLLAPLVGFVLAVVAAIPLALLTEASPLLVAVLTIGWLALLTRGLHLDGLADTADGLGSGRPAAEALAVMRRSDIGPFGVVTLVIVLLTQVVALAQLLAEGHGWPSLAAALVVSRLALPLTGLKGVRAARPEGLGATVAGSVSVALALASVLLAFVLVVAVLLLAPSGGRATVLLAAAPAGLLAGLAVGAQAVRRFGGITGDVLGAVVEATFTGALVVLTLV